MAFRPFEQLIRRTNRLLLRLFSRKPEAGSIVTERWETSFSEKEAHRRFDVGGGPGYRAAYREGYFSLELQKPDFFAWVQDQQYQYDDVLVEIEMTIPSGAEEMNYSAGLLLRKISEDSFYYVLVSDTGMFRFDFVFNGHPRTLIPWTAAPRGAAAAEKDDSSGFRRVTLKLIARGTSFTFFIDGAWAGEVEDDGGRSGYIALAAQRYHARNPQEGDRTEVRFLSLLVESRPVEVEIEYLRWTRAIKPSPEQRIILARRFFDFGNFGPALIQLKRAFTGRAPLPEEELLLAECYLSLGFYDSALLHIERILEGDPGMEEALREKAGVLYLQGRIDELLGLLDTMEAQKPLSSALLNLRGNALSSLGRFDQAADLYRRAFEGDPSVSQFALNAAASFERSGKNTEALAMYRKAAGELYRQQAWDELERAIAAVRRYAPDDPEALAIEGKIAFEDGNWARAEALLRPLVQRGCGDSAVYYLCALLDLHRNDLASAAALTDAALALEPDYPLYHFKRAEIGYLSGKGNEEEARRALELDRENGWNWNLLGLILLDERKDAEALDLFEHAKQLLPEEPEPIINYSEALLRLRGCKAAVSCIDDALTCLSSPQLFNRKGNILSASHRYDEAADAYLAAARDEPANPLWRENGAAALLAADRVPEAERILARLLEENPTALRYRLTGQAAFRTGEYSRALSAFQAAVESDPKDPFCRADLAEMLMVRGRYSEADEQLSIAERAADDVDFPHIGALRRRLRDEGGEEYRCAGCGRSWWVPSDADAPDRLKLKGEPPAEAPAGKCPSCGAVFCVACGMEHLSEGRFHCPVCNVPLKLNDAGLRYLVMHLVSAGKNGR
ncbi:tetratricopeptide repeat protein [Sediminispirochaeta bajacaliforniensis]|uniref:tetratricopeptide repeat protein n=1 Tax=Sediminispirochaeta bajacaliforniensis TaxID=148 RepID=UPI00037061FA|nr:tetratricopeptide repeat protein [Sediminispirochaeta bajacaliforniensis]